MERKHSNSRSNHLLQKIRGFTRSIVEDLSHGRAPVIYINRFRNYCTDISENCYCSRDSVKGVEILTLQREYHARRLDILLRVLLIVQQLLQENRHGSKRDIYYMHPSVFREQSVVDRAINDICILLQCSRHNLNVVSVSKGLVMGWLRFSEADTIFNCINHPDTAHSIPVFVEEVKDIISVADYILVVEKESVFQRLANDCYCKNNRCIVITGRGYPDIPTRRFLRLLIERLHLPTYCLVDCDPYGFDILTTYRFGSMQMAYDAKIMKLPEIKWLGVLPSDAETFNVPQQCLLPMTTEDKIKTEAILNRCYLQREVPQWRLELQLLLQSGVKFETEALSVHSLDFLSKQYLPSKIQDMECSLRVHSNCGCCVMKTYEILRSVCGVYSVELDAEKNLFKISGEVNPNILLKAVLSTGEHAELVTVKMKHPQLRQRTYNYGSYGPANGYHLPYYRDAGYSNRSLANYPYYETNGHNYYPYSLPRDPPLIDYPSSYNNYYTTTSDYQYPPPRATYVPSYPPQEYDQYDNFDSISPCTIV
ncbi:putative DNA topoisomerase (ATP-hydrolyzing) [Helianthus annuus]|nr:putative DNA topoisomerase (ATP-hydrolyzing) [Helianthus annuus]